MWLDEIQYLLIDETQHKAVFFHKPEESYGYLSNWWMSDFTVDGICYSSCEQYIMHQKALLFDDVKIADRIMEITDVAQIQKLGRQVGNFNSVVWDGNKQLILYRGLMEKFSQNPDLREWLVGTSDSILVECAGSDKVWACGIKLDDPRRGNIDNWKGQNLLGFTLMAVRDRLQSETQDDMKPDDKGVTVRIVKVDITKLDVDCIVNAANEGLWEGGGVCGAIFRAAGSKELTKACQAIGHCNTGDVVATPGFNSKAKWIFHAVGPVWGGNHSMEKSLLYQCYQRAIGMADAMEIEKIAFPLISSGIFGVPKRIAWEVALEAIRENTNKSLSGYPKEIVFAVIDDETYNIGQKLLKQFF